MDDLKAIFQEEHFKSIIGYYIYFYNPVKLSKEIIEKIKPGKVKVYKEK